jgi:hypothetical protein
MEHTGASVIPHQILIVGIRVLGVFWFVSVLGQARLSFATIESMATSAAPLMISAGIQLLAIIGLPMIRIRCSKENFGWSGLL